MADLSSIFVTIRSSGERTEQACVQSVIDEGISKNQIHIVRETPFKKALEICFKKASESNAKWLLTLDADMILIPGILDNFFKEAERMPDNFLQLQGRVIDKFYGESRKGGPRFYRVCHVQKALSISEKLQDHIRPESNIINKMGESGHPSRYISPVISLHDFEQYYRDIYRKACIYAVKHMKIIPVFLKQATKEVSVDPDYQVILKGIYDSLSHNMEVKIDNRLFSEEAEKALLELGLREKEYGVKKSDLETILENFKKTFALDFEIEHSKDVPSKTSRVFLKNIKDKGVARGMIYFFGLSLTKIGNYFQRVVK